MWITASLLGLSLTDALVWDPDHRWIFLAVTGGFVASMHIVFHVEARNEAVAYTPSDVVLGIGLLLLNPIELLTARLIAAIVGSITSRSPAFKTAFNLGHFALETIVAVALYQLLVDVDSDPALANWGALVVALFIALVVGGIMVAGAISCFEGGFKSRALKELTNSSIFYLPGAVVAASVAIPVLVEPWLGLVAIGPTPLLWFVVRSHGALLHRYTDLTSVHEFSREVGTVADPDDIARKAVHQIANNLRARSVALRIWDNQDGAIDVVYGDDDAAELLPETADDETWSDLFANGNAINVSEVGAENGQQVVAPLVDERGPIGAVALSGRMGIAAGFDADDRSRLTSMSQQLAVAVRKGQFHAQIQYEATHDRLTGLPNRGFFEMWIEQSVSVAGAPPAATLLLDLDRFKEINDTFGHHAGDELLKAVARRIQRHCSEEHIAARFGGDEFAVFIPGADAVEAAAMAEAISTSLEEPFELTAVTVAIAASIGIALTPDHGTDSTTLLRRADIAMYDAKRRHVRSCLYHDDLEENDSVRLELLADLRTALESRELQVYFQPKVNIRSDQVVAAEALVRWDHAERGFINPETFVGLAEQSGLIEELTRQVLSQALDAAKTWRDKGWRLSVAVNVSAQSLLDEQLEGLVAAELSRSGVDPALLTLEITESTMMGDPDRTDRILRSLHAFGVNLSVDDFGTGFSSLVNLRRMPVSELKIDRSFVTDMLAKNSDEVIVRSTVDLGHNLGLTVVAEGVENNDVQTRLGEMGCDVAQGYGISRPLPIEAFDEWLEERLAGQSQQPKHAATPSGLSVPI